MPQGTRVKPIRLSDLRTEVKAQYRDVRSHIRIGDLLLFQGKMSLSRLICWASHGLYSHAALVAPAWNDRVLVMQAELFGVEIVPVSHAVDRYDGRVEWWALKEEQRQRLMKPDFLTALLDPIGKPFAIGGIIWFGLKLLLGIRQYVPNRKASSYFCSQYVAEVLRKNGLDVGTLSNEETSPTDIAQSGLFEYRKTLHVSL